MIENHNGDSLANTYSNARNTYYNIGGYPTYFFDGVLSVVGGNGSSSIYSSFVPKVNARNAIMSDFTIDVVLEETDGNYSANITMENVGGNTSSSLVLQAVLTESKLPISWGLTDEQNYVNRLMIPDQNGTSLDFSGGDVQEVTLDFTTDGGWDSDNCELVVFIQDNATKEIKQGTKIFVAIPMFNIDAQAKSLIYPEGNFCGSSVSPVVKIKNMGSENLTSLDIQYSINGGTSQDHAWTGDLEFNVGEDIELPEIAFSSQTTNSIEVTVSNPNGQPDPNPDNDHLLAEFESAPQVGSSTVLFELMTDTYPEETTWELLNSNGEVIYSGGPYSGGNTVYNETWDLQDLDCYTFIIYDSYGDGICCAYGNGYYKVMDENNTILYEGGEFGASEASPFEIYDESVLSADFTADFTTIFEGESVGFSDLSSGAGISTWAWEFEGGDPATSDEQNPVVMYLVEGMYDVTLTVSNGSNSNTIVKEEYIHVEHIVGIGDDLAEGVKLFPNPTNGIIHIEGVNGASVKVYNTTGSIVKSINKMKDGKIDLSHMEEGIYFIHIQTTDGLMINEKVSLLK